ncbi:trypsin-like peptidase domain-containing protein, partial [Candidatus Poribacteria bacterium]|nr:trypsin-like peptidase domain-containing protein [Candidatus Poribacteria bacterium]
LIAMLIILFCTTNVVHALTNEKRNQIRNATVFIETENGIGTGFYISANTVATCLHLIAGATNITIASENGRNLGVSHLRAYDSTHDIAFIGVQTPNHNFLNITTNPVQGEQIHAVGYDENGILQIKSSRIERHSYKDFCYSGIRFPITISSDGGPVLDIHGNVKGIFFIGMLRAPSELAELNYSFVVPASKLSELFRKTWSFTLPKSVELKVDHCKLIRQGNAKLRKSKWLDRSRRYDEAVHYSKLGKQNLENGLDKLLRKRKIPYRQIVSLLRKAAKLF